MTMKQTLAWGLATAGLVLASGLAFAALSGAKKDWVGKAASELLL